MEKRTFKVTLIADDTKEEYNLLGDYEEDKKIITYSENDELNTIMKLDLINQVLIRENDSFLFNLPFDINSLTKARILIKELNQEAEINIKTEKFNIIDNNLELSYIITDSNDKITYKIEF